MPACSFAVEASSAEHLERIPAMPATASSAQPSSDHKAANGSVTTEDQSHVELKDMPSAQGSLPIEEDIMQLARLGEIGAIQKLFDAGKYDATYADEQGITPLHVRSIEA